MIKRGSQSKVGTTSIGAGTSGGFGYKHDSNSYLDYKDLGKNDINLNRLVFFFYAS